MSLITCFGMHYSNYRRCDPKDLLRKHVQRSKISLRFKSKICFLRSSLRARRYCSGAHHRQRPKAASLLCSARVLKLIQPPSCYIAHHSVQRAHRPGQPSTLEAGVSLRGPQLRPPSVGHSHASHAQAPCIAHDATCMSPLLQAQQVGSWVLCLRRRGTGGIKHKLATAEVTTA